MITWIGLGFWAVAKLAASRDIDSFPYLTNPWPGKLKYTGKEMDVALFGEGFMQVLCPDGRIGLTRSVHLMLSPNGRIVTDFGQQILPSLWIPDGYRDIRLRKNGNIEATPAGSRKAEVLGRIDLALVPNVAGLRKGDNNLYFASDACGNVRQVACGESGSGTLAIGFQESPWIPKVTVTAGYVKTRLPLDIAIEGDGLLCAVSNLKETVYTRFGRLTINRQNELCLENGSVIQPPVFLPKKTQSIHIDTDGAVNVLFPDENTPRTVGQIKLTRVQSPRMLEALGNQLWRSTVLTGNRQMSIPGEDGVGKIRQFFLDISGSPLPQRGVK